MKIIDIRANLVKIESSIPLSVASLLKLVDNETVYLAQVLYVEKSGMRNVVFAKVMSLFDTPFVPIESISISTSATCEAIAFTDVVSNFGEEVSVVLGETATENSMLTSDMKFFDKKIIVVSENKDSSDLILRNFARQIKNLGYTTIVFDTEGSYEGIKLVAGKDFKLPLNAHSIQFIYDKYFADITDASKALVADIFKELKEYAETVPFIPFKTFKSVVDEVVNFTQNLQLFFFKTKMNKLQQENIFADSREEIMDWGSLAELGAGNVVVDLSSVEKLFTGEYISHVVSSLENSFDKEIYAFIKLNDSFVDKDFLRELLEAKKVISSYVVRSDFKFLAALRQNCSSYIVTSGVKKVDNFDYCKFLLKGLPADKYVLSGTYTFPFSVLFNLKEIEEVIPQLSDIPADSESIVVEESPDSEIVNEAKISPALESEMLESDNEEASDNEVVLEKVQYEEVPDVELEDESETQIVEEIADYEPLELPSEETQDVEDIIEPSEVVQDVVEEIEETYESALEEAPVEESFEGFSVQPEELLEDVQEQVVETSSEEIIVDEVNTELIQEDTVVLDEYEPVEVLTDESEGLILEEHSQEVLSEVDEVVSEDLVVEDAVLLPEADFELELEDDTILLEEDSEEVLEPIVEKSPEELLDEEIKRDVDKVYMAAAPDDSDVLSEDDLDFIEELVETDELIVEEEPIALEEFVDPQEEFQPIQEELQPVQEKQDVLVEDTPFVPIKNTATPAVPIYSAEIPDEALVQSDPVQQGDRVIHVKFGIGVVEKIFSYGTKNFCSINFENIGRKVLDPNVTELKKA